MNITVVGDSIDEARQLIGFIPAYCSDIHTCQQTVTFSTVASFPRCWQKGSFDLISIDIFLRSETSGTRIVERARRDDNFCTIVSTTSSTDFALKNYEIRALDYMIRLIRHEKLCQTMKYFMSVSRRKQSHYIEIKESRITFKTPIDSIFYTDYSNRYTQVHLSDKTVCICMWFEEFSGVLLIYFQLIYCYRSRIINMNKVFFMEKSESISTAGEHLPIIRTTRLQVHQQYADYQFSKLNGGI